MLTPVMPYWLRNDDSNAKEGFATMLLTAWLAVAASTPDLNVTTQSTMTEPLVTLVISTYMSQASATQQGKKDTLLGT